VIWKCIRERERERETEREREGEKERERKRERDDCQKMEEKDEGGLVIMTERDIRGNEKGER
jgi:hypothetical protein